MTNAVAAARPFLEAASFLASVALLGIAIYGLKQIRLLKMDIRLRTERAAKEKAIEAAQSYLNSYTILSGVFTYECHAQKMTAWEGGISDFTANSIRSNKYASIAAKRFAIKSWLPAINMLDSIAATYVTGVADEQTGFAIIGRTFCATVEHNYDIISFCRVHDAHSYFQSIVTLYQTWAPRLTRGEIDEAKRRLEERASTISTSTIPSLGSRETAN